MESPMVGALARGRSARAPRWSSPYCESAPASRPERAGGQRDVLFWGNHLCVGGAFRAHIVIEAEEIIWVVGSFEPRQSCVLGRAVCRLDASFVLVAG